MHLAFKRSLSFKHQELRIKRQQQRFCSESLGIGRGQVLIAVLSALSKRKSY